MVMDQKTIRQLKTAKVPLDIPLKEELQTWGENCTIEHHDHNLAVEPCVTCDRLRYRDTRFDWPNIFHTDAACRESTKGTRYVLTHQDIVTDRFGFLRDRLDVDNLAAGDVVILPKGTNDA